MYADHFDFSAPLLWTVEGLLSAAECATLIQEQEQADWLPATVNSAAGRVVEEKIRSSTTAVLHDPHLGEWVYQRVLPYLPQVMIDRIMGPPRQVHPVGLYLPLRIYRYEPGQYFAPHHDQSYQDGQGHRSLLTFMIYLNQEFQGGATVFPEQGRTIEPRTGMALLFQHMLLHEGERATVGMKYVLRSDVIYGDGTRPAGHEHGAW